MDTTLPDIEPEHARISSISELVAYFESGCKPIEDWRIGTEHEKFGFYADTLQAVPHEGGIEALLQGLTRFGWEPVTEAGHLIALKRSDGSSVTLEPGGQLELSGAPLETIHQTCAEVGQHLIEVREVASELGIKFTGMGFQPRLRRDQIHWMPKQRYRIMREYMPRVGKLGLDMMLRTCTVQVNLDYASEADMVQKLQVSLALQPLATALFANSPFTEGKPNGALSYRSNVWKDTDPDRSGMLPFAFEAGMGFERWVDYLLDVPMYFVMREGQYIDASGQSFRDFMAGRLPALPGERPTMSDFEDHMTTVFPEVRLKRFLEMRGADGGPWRRLCALPAFWVGLLYDQTSLDAAHDLVRSWTAEDRQKLRDEVPTLGLSASVAGQPLAELAQQCLTLSREGLVRRQRLNASGQDESRFLEPLVEIARSGVTPAERKLALYYGPWNESVDPLFSECVY